MKSTIFSILPIAGFAAAESYCSVQTYTKTEYETPSTSTSTIEDYVTVTVRPTGSECAATPSSAPLASVSASPSGAPLPSFQLASSLPGNVVSESKTPVAYSTAAPPTGSPVPYPSPASPMASSTAAAASAAASPMASPSSSSAGSKRGEATFYGGNLDGGMCSLTGYKLPSGIFGTALTDSDWDSANACGTCVSVTGPSGDKITAMVVDQCPGCGPHHLDLFPDAFKKLADPSKGIIDVSWEVVPCGITTPIILKNKSGTSANWFSMQVMNSNVEVTSLDVSTDGGKTWKGTKRQPYNFFENSAGFGTDSVDVKITSSGGQSIIVQGVSVASGTTKTGTSNFA
ncbi:carbohydrate-binding module family 63 protein [Bipolaris maydis]|nr:carbohydrate-binding module family 63 protein [Bipolaris maydis]KAJ6271932.1 carbohydrate-binding module family 63 protein [Bipolaris maydis]KAJ6281977.1 carbohydrate-binding module family 63 protein [Bipolaris maydis]